MENQTYNGWTNYATWRINLEIFDGVAFIEDETLENHEIAQRLKEYVEDYLTEQSSGIALDYALAFIDEVNWYEIADSMIAQFEQEEI